jgi:hypothetical protein
MDEVVAEVKSPLDEAREAAALWERRARHLQTVCGIVLATFVPVMAAMKAAEDVTEQLNTDWDGGAE